MRADYAEPMTTGPFITRPLSLSLDLIRALAALAVLLGHAVQLGLYTGPFPFTLALQKNAVVVFFVLSGLVIAASVDARGGTLRSFAIARITRIVPVALGAVALSVLVGAADAFTRATPLHSEDALWADPAQTLRALLFLSESYAQEYALNPPWWSLCYEVWFYALFGAATFLSGRTRTIWVAVLALIAGPNILMLLPVWLIGVALARMPKARRVPRGRAELLVTVALAGLFIAPALAEPLHRVLRVLAPWNHGSSFYALSDLVLGIAIAAGFAGLRTLGEHGLALPAWSERPIRAAANMSFSLYVLHWPLLKLANIAGLDAGTSLPGFAGVLLAVIAVSAAFAALTEHRRAAFQALLESSLQRRPALGAA